MTTASTRTVRAKNITVSDYLTQQFNLCGKSQTEIAREVGFKTPNIVSMIKQGITKLPIDKVGLMAKAIGVDPVYLLRLAMQEYEPETWEVIQTIIGATPITENEREILEVVRSSNVPNPKLRTDEERRMLLDVIATLKPDNAVYGD